MRKLTITYITLVLAACATSPVGSPSKLPPPPATEARPVAEVLNGVDITDPYQWLEDQKSPETRAWIDSQNAYTDKVLGPRREARLFAPRLAELLSTDETGTPVVHNGRYFFPRRAAGQDLYSIYMREGANGQDQLLIDPAPLSTDHTTSIDIRDVSNDGSLLAYGVRRGGADEVEIRFYDVNARHDVGDPLPPGRYYGVDFILTDKPGVFFSRMTTKGIRIFYRDFLGGGREITLFGGAFKSDKILFSTLSDDDRYLLIHVYHGSAPKRTEIYVEDLSDNEPIRAVVNDLDARSTAFIAGDQLVIQTNWKAPNDRIMTADIHNPEPKFWKEIVPQNPKAAIQGTTVAGGRVYVRYLEDVKPRIAGYDLAGNKKDEIQFETFGNLEDLHGSWTAPVAFFTFSSFHIPPTLYQYDVAKGERTVFARQSAPVNADDFTLEQVWYPSKDGTRIPMFVLSRKGLEKNGTSPAYLVGYGGFLSSQLPSFSPRAIAWVEQGGIVAVPNLRGGGEFGEEWHRAGMLDKKQNTFDDFAAAAEYLIRERYTSSEHLAVAGASNGGLLVTALATQHPELAAAVLARYPLTDMLRYHKFMVGSFWIPEYGLAEKQDEFKWIYAYSPYQHVTKGTKYPATLFVTGDSDTRVAPLHARKMAALMQASSASGKPILLRYHVATGHSGGEPVPVQVKNTAEELGFLWWQVR
jgi:prolyl oligopeptidase